MVDTKTHALLVANLRSFFQEKLSPPARLLAERERVVTGVSSSFPDVSITNDPAQTDSRVQPVVVFEVLARRTENLERTHKWIALQSLSALQNFALISQERIRVEVFSRSDDGWGQTSFVKSTDEIPLPSLGLTLPVSRIYAGAQLLR